MRTTLERTQGFGNVLVFALLPNLPTLALSLSLFGDKGTLVVAYLASLALIVRSCGIRFRRDNLVAAAKPGVSLLGRLMIIHCHHPPAAKRDQHAFLIRGKYLCAGCYGLALGTMVSLVMPTVCLARSFKVEIPAILSAAAPFCFLPGVVRCTTQMKIGALFRFVSYGLLPIGTWIIILTVHARFHSWLLNTLVLTLVVLGWNAGGLYLAGRQEAS
jgi:uncharacterized membrane protein